MSEHAIIDGSDVLIVVDVQNDFCPGGALQVPRGDEVVPIVNRLAARFRNVVLTQDWHPAGHFSFASTHSGKQPFATITAPYGPQVLWPYHCVRGSFGAEFHPALDIPHAALVLRKGMARTIDSYSAF
jgi:nicotinamidase/pyrazinamidase